MPNSSNLFFFLFFAIFAVPSTSATDYVVGDDVGWTTGVNYSRWTMGKTFFVGDKLIFRYERGVHNVLKVDGIEFERCTASSSERPLQSGNDVIPLLRPGRKWYICDVVSHCAFGQKLVITVHDTATNNTASAPATSAPSPRPTPQLHSPAPQLQPHSPLPSAAAPPPPPSGAPTKARRLGFLVVAIGVIIMV